MSTWVLPARFLSLTKCIRSRPISETELHQATDWIRRTAKLICTLSYKSLSVALYGDGLLKRDHFTDSETGPRGTISNREVRSLFMLKHELTSEYPEVCFTTTWVPFPRPCDLRAWHWLKASN